MPFDGYKHSVELGVELLHHWDFCRFSFDGQLPNIFQNVCTNLHSYQWCMKVPVAPHP